MRVTSQLPIQTTKFAIISFQCALVPPHFEKGSATHGLDHLSTTRVWVNVSKQWLVKVLDTPLAIAFSLWLV